MRPSDVVFDDMAAAAALEAIAAMRFTLEWGWAAEDRSALAALARWDGLAADAFEASHRARRAATEELVGRLVLLAGGLEHAIQDAVAEQARVEAMQAEWDAQLRLERQAAADAAAAAEADGADSGGRVGTVPAGLR